MKLQLIYALSFLSYGLVAGPVGNEPIPAPATGKFEVHEAHQPYIASIDIHGTSRLGEVQLRKEFRTELDTWFKKGLEGDPGSIVLQDKLTKKIIKKYGFATAEFSILEHFDENNYALRVTLDVVEKKDVKRRMPFRKAPKQALGDPGKLIAKWREYEKKSLVLAQNGDLNAYEAKCKKAFHCLFGHAHKDLKPYELAFVKGVAKHHKQLVRILVSDRDKNKRATAAFLLPYYPDGKKVASWMIKGIKDPSADVRNNALRVLGDISEFHPEIVIPVSPIVQALDFPVVTDRSKAVYTLFSMAGHSNNAKKQIQNSDAAKYLVKMLKSQQPSEGLMSYRLLKKISGKKYKQEAYSQWRKWAERVPAKK